MTRLLVSVRDATEALAAIRGGAELIDVKEPSRGSLGAAKLETWDEIIRVVNGSRPVSVALGELLDPETASHIDDVQHVAAIRFAKVGLSGCLDEPTWQDCWLQFQHRLPASVSAVAVAYADWMIARSPKPGDVLRFAVQRSCQVMLLDTFDKQRGHLFDFMDLSELKRFMREVRAQGMFTVVGGSLTRRLIRNVLQAQPDFIAVRGAACAGERTASIDETRVRELAETIRQESKVPSAWQVSGQQKS
jgi:uncharacterized protein (UPF0264 family)